MQHPKAVCAFSVQNNTARADVDDGVFSKRGDGAVVGEFLASFVSILGFGGFGQYLNDQNGADLDKRLARAASGCACAQYNKF